jgi:hypothetical protein
MALYKVAAHACVCRDGTLEVDLGTLLERAQVGSAEGFGGASNLERRLGELGDGKTRACPSQTAALAVSLRRTVDTDAVTQMGVAEDVLTSRYRQRCAAASRRGLVELLKGGNS